MRVTYCIGDPPARTPALVIPGAFDGAHRGHLAVLRQAAEVARRERLPLAVALLWPGCVAEATAPCLSLLGERIDILRATGLVDEALVISHAPDTGPLTPDEVLDRASEWYDLRTLLLAQDEPFADALRAGALRAGALARNWRVVALEHLPESERITSGSVYDALTQGNLSRANALLGRPYAVAGMVIGGDRRGRLLGFPTANLRVDARKALPADGIYAVRARLPGETEARRAAVVSLGVRPQFGSGKPRLVEVYLMDTSLDLYGEPLQVEFIARLRGEERFESVEALQEQMARDVENARRTLASESRGDG